MANAIQKISNYTAAFLLTGEQSAGIVKWRVDNQNNCLPHILLAFFWVNCDIQRITPFNLRSYHKPLAHSKLRKYRMMMRENPVLFSHLISNLTSTLLLKVNFCLQRNKPLEHKICISIKKKTHLFNFQVKIYLLLL